MHVCHLTPHLPPDQAANALLPVQLGTWARTEGHDVSFVAFPPRARGSTDVPGPVVWIGQPSSSRIARATRLRSARVAIQIVRDAAPLLRPGDIVHLHSNGLLTELGGLLAARLKKPTVLTLYGTEIWHYQPTRLRPDLFTRAYRRAAAVTFYSHGLRARAEELGLRRRGTHVIYPPVTASFTWHDAEDQLRVRRAIGLRNRHLLINVKRLHPLAGQKTLIQAMGEVVRTHPDSRLILCGTGPLQAELARTAEASGVSRHVTFAGLVPNDVVAQYCAAADVFVLPSLLEACPTVALEALATGTPVISSDNPGGVELHDLFGVDVQVVPREQPVALARALTAFLDDKRRATRGTRDTIDRELRPAVVAARYRDVYDRALADADDP